MILIGTNEFYIAGSLDDPAGIAESKNVVEAYKKIAVSETKFFSRGGNSGTHKKEMEIWNEAGMDPEDEW
jgi:tungstate transport system substrate-binding protein